MHRARAFSTLLAALLVLSTAACSAEDDGISVDRDLTLTTSAAGGWDDWGSMGAAFAYAVDTQQQVTLVAAFKFDLPAYKLTYTPSGSPASYPAKPTLDPVPGGVAVDTYPILRTALTDTAGVRTMTTQDALAKLVLLAGDPAGATPTKLFVADAGQVVYVRGEGDYVIEGVNVRFREVDGLGEGASLVDGGEVLRIPALYVEYVPDGNP